MGNYFDKYDTAGGQPMREPSDPEAYWPYRLAKGMLESGQEAATLPGKVYSGEKQISDLTPADTLNLSSWAMPINPAVRAGDRAIPGVGLARKEGVPSEAMLYNKAGQELKAFHDTGIHIKGDYVKEFAGRLKTALDKQHILELDAPSTYNLINKKLASPPEGAFLDTTAFHSFRKKLGDFAKKTEDGKPTGDAVAAQLAIRGLDQFFERLPQAGFMDGTTAAQVATARKAFRNFRGNYAAAERNANLSKIEDSADRSASSTNSGRNFDNRTRQKINSMFENPKKLRGYSPEEVGSMRTAIDGSPLQNNLRNVSNLLGGGGGLGASILSLPAVAWGMQTGQPLLAGGAALAGQLPGLVGAGLKAGENYLARKNLHQAGETVRKRSPLAEEGGPYQGAVVSGEKRAMLLRSLPALFKTDPQAALELYYKLNPNSL